MISMINSLTKRNKVGGGFDHILRLAVDSIILDL